MIRLSRIIKDSREARAKLNSIQAQTEYFIVEGNQSTFIRDQANSSITNCLYVEQYLRSSVSNACKCLDGFDASKMEPIDYISSSDVKISLSTYVQVRKQQLLLILLPVK